MAPKLLLLSAKRGELGVYTSVLSIGWMEAGTKYLPSLGVKAGRAPRSGGRAVTRSVTACAGHQTQSTSTYTEYEVQYLPPCYITHKPELFELDKKAAKAPRSSPLSIPSC